MHQCDQMIVGVEMEGSVARVNEMFERAQTDAGYCCSFNQMAQQLQA